MTDVVGSASIRIDPDLSYFSEELRSKLEEATAGRSVNVGIGADAADAQSAVAQLESQLGAVGSQGAKATLGIDNTQANAAIKDTEVKLNAYGLEHKTATIDVKTSGTEFSSASWDSLDRALTKTGIDAEIFTDKMVDAGHSADSLGKISESSGMSLGDMAKEIQAASDQGVPFGSVLEGIKAKLVGVGDYSSAARPAVTGLGDGFRQTKNDADVTVLGLQDVIDRLAGMGLATRNSGGDLVNLRGELTTASSVLKEFGLVLDHGEISSQGFNDTISRFAHEGLSEFKTAAEGGNQSSDSMNASIKRLASEGLSEAGKGFRDLFGDSTHYVGGMSAVQDANKAVDVGLKAARDGFSAVATGIRAATGEATAITSILGEAGGAAGQAGGSVAKLSASLSAMGDAAPPMWAVVAVLATGLIPIAGVAVGVVGALVTAIAAAGLGLGAFALAASGQFGRVTTTLKNEVANWQAQLKSSVQPVVDGITGLIAPALNSLTPIAEEAAGALGPLISGVKEFLGGSQWSTFVEFIAGQVGPALNTFIGMTENLVSGLMKMAEIGGPFIAVIEQGLVHLSAEFNTFGGSNQFKTFIDYVQKEAPVVGQAFEAILAAAMKLIVALAPVGDLVLHMVTGFANMISLAAPLLGFVAQLIDLLSKLAPLNQLVFKGLDAAMAGVEKGVGNALHGILSFTDGLFGISGPAQKSGDDVQGATAKLEKMGLSATAAARVIKEMGDTTVNASTAANFALEQSANKVGITTEAFAQLEKQTKSSATQVVSDLEKTARSAGITTQGMAALELQSGLTGKVLSSAISQAANATQASFASAANAVSHFSGQVNVSGDDIQTFYATQTLNAASFTQNIQQALKDGYNPSLIEQILEAGPAKANGFLQSLVANASGDYVNQINSAQAALSKIGQEAVEEARLTEQAIKSGSSKMADDIGSAMQIQQTRAVQGTSATVQSIAQQLGLGEDQVAQIAQEFGILIPNAITGNIPGAGKAAQSQADQVRQANIAALVQAATSADQLAQTNPNALTKAKAAVANAALSNALTVPQATLSQLQAAAQAADLLAMQQPTRLNLRNADAANAALANAQTPAQAMVSQLQAAANAANQLAALQPNALTRLAAATADAAYNNAVQQQQALTGQLTPVQQISSVLGGSLFQELSKHVTDVFGSSAAQGGAVGGGLASKYNDVFGAASFMSGGVAGHLQIGDTSPIGAGAGQGLIDGLNSKVQAGIQAAENAASSILHAIANIFKPGSPSKVTTIMGQQVGQGIAVGIESTIPDVLAAAHNMSNAVIGGLGGTPSGAVRVSPNPIGTSIGQATVSTIGSVASRTQASSTAAPVEVHQTNIFNGVGQETQDLIDQSLAKNNKDLVQLVGARSG